MQTVGGQYNRLPEELKRAKQWCIAGPDKAPYGIGEGGSLRRIGVHDYHRFMEFQDAVSISSAFAGAGIGFIVTDQDSFTCIDIDFKDHRNEPNPAKHSTPDQIQRFNAIIGAFDTYTEVSRGGLGVHIWCKGGRGAGVRRDGVEVYSKERFIICTGNVMSDRPLEERGELVAQLVSEIERARGAALDPSSMEEMPEDYDDEEILERARNAGNCDKFNDLYAGNWDSYIEYPSQSEADLSLMSMFAFYSRSNEQCRRLFRGSALGKRDKAARNDRYLNRTLAIVRGRQQEEDAAYQHGQQIANTLLLNQMGKDEGESEAAPVASQDTAPEVSINLENQLAKLAVCAPLPPILPPDACAPAPAPTPAPTTAASKGELTWPPGLIGDIAKTIHASSPRPVKEVSIVAAIGLIAGIAGKQFNISGSGLNLYIILIARSAIGKEAMHGGISQILNDMAGGHKDIMQYVEFTDYASGPALSKACAAKTCFVNVSGEWGRKLKRLADDSGRDAAMAGLRTTMTNLYQKSGRSSIVGGLGYSNKDDNIASVSGVAYSMIGETTPGTFFDSLTDTMMEDGFLSRFNLIEYTGERPAANPNPLRQTPLTIKERLGHLLDKVAHLEVTGLVVDVQLSSGAAYLMEQFDQECDKQINSTDDESWRQMWNRAQLKALRLAALLTVADNYEKAEVFEEQAVWAIDLIRRDIEIMTRRMDEGDVGQGDGVRERKLLSVLKEYLGKPPAPSHNIPKGMREDRVVPRQYLLNRIQRTSSFRNHRLGSTAALDLTLRSMADSGIVTEVPKTKLIEKYSKQGKAFLILQDSWL